MKKLIPADFEAVRKTVSEVESKTRGEILPLVVESVGDYGWVRDRLALVGLFSSVFFGEGWSWVRAWPLEVSELTGLVVVGALLGALLGTIPWVARRLVGNRKIALAVHRRALAEFTERGCGNTREETGILVMVALFERRIEVIADRGIQKIALEKEGPGVWEKVTSDFSRAAGEGRAVDGLIDVIQGLGLMLAKHFPSDGKSAGELTDDLQVGE